MYREYLRNLPCIFYGMLSNFKMQSNVLVSAQLLIQYVLSHMCLITLPFTVRGQIFISLVQNLKALLKNQLQSNPQQINNQTHKQTNYYYVDVKMIWMNMSGIFIIYYNKLLHYSCIAISQLLPILVETELHNYLAAVGKHCCHAVYIYFTCT